MRQQQILKWRDYGCSAAGSSVAQRFGKSLDKIGIPIARYDMPGTYDAAVASEVESRSV